MRSTQPTEAGLAGVLRGNTIRGNRTRNSEEDGTLRGALRGPLKNLCWKPLKTSENVWRPLKTSENLWKPLKTETLSEADFPLRISQACCPCSCCPLIFLQRAHTIGDNMRDNYVVSLHQKQHQATCVKRDHWSILDHVTNHKRAMSSHNSRAWQSNKDPIGQNHAT